MHPTIFWHIFHVLPSYTAPGCCCWTVTVADRQGVTVTVDLEAEALQTYERFQAALLRKPGAPSAIYPLNLGQSPRRPHLLLSRALQLRRGKILA